MVCVCVVYSVCWWGGGEAVSSLGHVCKMRKIKWNVCLCFCLKEEIYKKDFELPLPSDIVPDSARGYVTVIGEWLSPGKHPVSLSVASQAGRLHFASFSSVIFNVLQRET